MVSGHPLPANGSTVRGSRQLARGSKEEDDAEQ